MRVFVTLLLVAAICVGPAGKVQAQDNAEDGGEQICLSVARGWTGTISDLKAIRTVPVPKSFSRQIEGGGCTAWQLNRPSLINWHLAFGDETTTTSALAYLETRTLAGKPIRSKLSPESKADVNAAEAYRFLAMEYARAAEFYSSLGLLAKAQRFAEPSLAIALALRAPRKEGSKLQPFDDYADRLWRDLDLQLAVASARIGGTEADFAAAREIFARNDDLFYDEAGEHGYQHGDNFCDIGDNSYLSAWKEACETANYERRAISYWRYRASFSLAAQVAGVAGMNKVRDEWDGDRALRLIGAEQRNLSDGLPEQYLGEATFAVTDIRFSMAEVAFAKAKRGSGQAEHDTYYALSMFWKSATYVQGTNHPGWLRRIGLRYLEASAFLNTVRDPNEPLWPDHVRRLAWFRTVLPQLDAMARGETAPQP